MQNMNSMSDIGGISHKMVGRKDVSIWMPRHCCFCSFCLTNNNLIAKDFIRKLLTLEPSARLTAEEALKDKWMTGSDATDIDILPAVRENFNPRRTLKNAVRAVSAMNRLRAASIEKRGEGNDEKNVAQLAILRAMAANKNKQQQQQASAPATTVPATTQ